MISPSAEVREALENTMATRNGTLIREWIEASLADIRATVESAGTRDRDFHAGGASQLAELLKSLPKPRW